MTKLETKEFFYQTDDVDGQVYLYSTDVTGECGKALLTVLVEERTSKPMSSPIDVKDLITKLEDLISQVKSGVLHEKA